MFPKEYGDQIGLLLEPDEAFMQSMTSFNSCFVIRVNIWILITGVNHSIPLCSHIGINVMHLFSLYFPRCEQ
ncbi:hypothetical protein CHUAL_001130 [Chamberlinius hualienensis]